jgi:serine/threonine protein kinase
VTPDSPIGSIIGGCRIEAEIGHGGMGVVYRAEQLSLRRRVALKLLPAALSHDPEFRARFEQEARIAASLDHPNVVPIFDYGESDGQLFIVMRCVDGTDLRRLMRREETLSPSRAARIVAQIGAALDAAHAQGLVHRDVKPGNVLLRPGAGDDHVYLSDFGLTKLADESRGLTRTGQWLGTPDYAAPEQIEGRRVDARTDVYALGCMLHEMLTGQVPFPRDATMASLWAHVNEPAPRPSEHGGAIPPAFDAIVARALAKDPDERYASAGDLGRAALAAAEGRALPREDRSVATGEASPLGAAAATRQLATVADRRPARTHVQPSARPRAGRRSRRTPVALALAALLLAGGGALAAALLSRSSSPSAATHVARTSTKASHHPQKTVPSVPRTTTTAPVTPPPEPPSNHYDVSRQRWTTYVAPAYHVDRPVGWAMQKDFHPENSIRSRSEWTDPICDCDLVIDYIAGYGESAMQNASETSGGTKQPTSIGTFDDAALRQAVADSGQHEATYFLADGTDNYAVRATAPTAATALELARRIASSLLPYGE